MRYQIEFVQQGDAYFTFPFGSDGTGLDELAQRIIGGFFDENDSPRAQPSDPRIPNEVRIKDDAGAVVARWSLADEHERRQSKRAK